MAIKTRDSKILEITFEISWRFCDKNNFENKARYLEKYIFKKVFPKKYALILLV